MSPHGTEETLCPVCGREHAAGQESCQVRLGSEPDRTRLDSGPYSHWKPARIGRDERIERVTERDESTTGARERERPRRDTGGNEHTSPISFGAVPESGLERGTQIGEFIVEGKIGAGGMGVVYRATHPLIGKKAVIKVIKASLLDDAEHVQRFIREARAVNQIGHPNIVDVFSFGTLPDKRPYLVMEWLQGESLGRRLERGRVPTREALEILVQIVSALDAAHTYGVVHRDLKPDNVYLVALPNDDRPLVKLLDFGLAKITEASKDLFLGDNEADVILGTPSYLSPEVARGHEVDHRSDIYTLGVLAFEMLSGRRPFLGSTPRETIFMHITAPPPRVRALVPEIPEAIESLLLEMMAKNPAQRPSLSRVRGVLAKVVGNQAEGPGVEAPPEEETTGARTGDFSPFLRALASRRPADWSGVVAGQGMQDLEERAPEPSREESTRTDTDLLAGMQRTPVPERADAPPSMAPLAPQASDGVLFIAEDSDAGDGTRVATSPPMPPRPPNSQRLAGIPLLEEPPPPPVRVDSRPAVDATPRRSSALPSLPKLPKRDAAARIGAATSKVRAMAAEKLAAGWRTLGTGGRVGLVVGAIALLLGGGVLLTRARNGESGGDEVSLYVRGLPPGATLTWGKRVLPSNPTSVPRSNEPVQLSIAAPGYQTVELELTPSTDLEFAVALGSPRKR